MQKVAIVTGGSIGIGSACVKKLASSNIKVIANYNKSEDKAKELQEELREQGIEIDIFKADVSKRSEAKLLTQFALEKYGRVDILVNNARNFTSKTFY